MFTFKILPHEKTEKSSAENQRRQRSNTNKLNFDQAYQMVALLNRVIFFSSQFYYFLVFTYTCQKKSYLPTFALTRLIDALNDLA